MNDSSKLRVVCIGGSTIDINARLLVEDLVEDGSNPVRATKAFGGVARNIAEAIIRCSPDIDVSLITSVGASPEGAPDIMGQAILNHLQQLGVDVVHTCCSAEHQTGTFIAALRPSGELLYGFADCSIVEQTLTPEFLECALSQISQQPISMIMCDANLCVSAIEFLAHYADTHHIPLWFEPTSPEKFKRAFSSLSSLTFVSPSNNEYELLMQTHGASTLPRIIIHTQGSSGARIIFPRSPEIPPIAVPASPLPGPAVAMTGAGDCLVAGFVAYYLQHPDQPYTTRLSNSLVYATKCASASILCADPVPLSFPSFLS